MAEPVVEPSEIEIGEADRRTARALVEALRRAAADLPFGLEPQDFAAALERLAEPEPARGAEP
jgi:hypothetical protein